MLAKEANPNAKPEGYAESPNAAAISDRAGLVYYHIDMVAQAIAADPDLSQEYAAASPDDKKRIFGDVYAQLKANKKLDNPTPEAISDAGSRWRHYALYTNEHKLWNECVDCPEFDIDQKRNHDLMAVMDSLMAKDYGVLEEITERFVESGKPIVDYEAEMEQGLEQEDKDNPRTKKYGELFPRPKPAFKIEKDLQPFNIKAGLKMMDMIVAAMQKITVKNPWYIDKDDVAQSGSTNPGTTNPGTTNPGTTNPGTANPGTANPDATNPTGSNPDNTVQGTEKGYLDGLDDNTIRHAAAMSAVSAGVKDIITELKVKDDPTATGIVDAMDYMNNLAINEPIVSYNNLPIPLPDAMRNVLFEFVSGSGKNPDGTPMTPEQQQADNTARLKQNIETLKGQVGKLKPGMPGADNIAKYTAMLDSFAYTFTSGLLTPAEVLKLIGMTSTSTMQAQNESGVIEISPGADLTPEQVATLKTCKTKEEFDKKAKEFGLYKQNVVEEVYGAKFEVVKAAGENVHEGGDGMGNA